jgi:orotate phosphoribosyltransferase
VQEVTALYGMPVLSIASLDDVLAFLDADAMSGSPLAPIASQVAAYRDRYGV